MSEDFFLEAHFYSGGLRHRAYSLSGVRPEWAPPADSVGFNDEFPLNRGAAAVEIKRLVHDNRRLTWLGIYHPSIDTKLGDRSNHAGVGLWLNELTVIDARSLIHGLNLLSNKLAQSVDAGALETHARDFLSGKFIPSYLSPLAHFPGFSGLDFARGPLAKTKFSYLESSGELGECASLANYVSSSLFIGPETQGTSRELICVSGDARPPADRIDFSVIPQDEDGVRKLLQAFPKVTETLIQTLRDAQDQVATLRSETTALQTRIAEVGDLQDRISRFEANPLNVVLDSIQELGSKIDRLASRPDAVRAMPVPSPVRHNPIRHPTPASTPRSEESIEYDYNWTLIFLFAFIVLVVGVAIFLALNKWGL